ncbi:MAG: substrate-binding domain-containing protein [Nitrospinae bacterium]|nr:substrate-binding domain-containing protein [Nitrospinota bacterium]
MIKDNKGKKDFFLTRVVFWALFVSFSAAVPAYAGEIVVIVNKGNKTSNLSMQDLQQIYQGGKKSWEGGESITLFLPPAKGEAMKALASKVFSMGDASGVSKFYLKAVFQQKFSSPPKSTDNSVAEVSATPGGIAIIDTAEAGDTGPVKVIKVGGL